MHNNYYFLKQLTTELEKHLIGAVLVECFTQNKNELIFGFTRNEESFYIKAYLDPSFCCLSFPEEFHRARKNSVDLFTDYHGLVVAAIRQFNNERCFALYFSDNRKLLFKMHGNRSNIIGFDAENTIQKVFNSKLKKDYEIDLEVLDRSIDQSKDALYKHEGRVDILFPTFGKEVKKYLKSNNYEERSIEDKWEVIQTVIDELNANSYYITKNDHRLEFSLLKTDSCIHSFSNPIEALTKFFNAKISTASIRELKHSALAQITKTIKQSRSYITKSKDRYNKILHGQSYNQLADILMANLHQIPNGATEVTLPNFYDNNKPLTIALKKNLSPQKNAEVYYRKSKNQSKEIKNLENSIAAKEELIESMELHELNIDEIDDYKALKQYLKSNNLISDSSNEATPTKPFNTIEYFGYQIFIGKNAKSNDKMLQKYAYKEDLWLHAKDVSGSHVLIKHQSGKNFPRNIIEAAASLAAYYSKRKTDTLCPVIVTPRKYVRKRKGDPAGAVVVDKEETIIVEPKARP